MKGALLVRLAFRRRISSRRSVTNLDLTSSNADRAVVSAERTGKVRKRAVLLEVALTAALSLLLLTIAGTRERGTSQANGQAAEGRERQAIKAKYGGKSITFIGDDIGLTHKRDLALAKQFTKDTGIKVKVIPHPAASDRLVLAARAALLVEVVVGRRDDARRRLAGRVRAVSGEPEAGARQGGEAALPGDHQGQHVQREARRDAVVRRLRDPVLPHRPAAGSTATDSPPTTWAQLGAMAKKIQDGRGADANRELLRLRLPGQLVRRPDLRRARVDRLERRWALHRRRQGHDQQPESRRRPEPPAQLGRQDRAARRDVVPGDARRTRPSRRATPRSCATGRTRTR